MKPDLSLKLAQSRRRKWIPYFVLVVSLLLTALTTYYVAKTAEDKDNGIGIAPEHQQRIFRVFERLHGIEAYPGTGIGLAIVRKGVERMGGHVGIKSQVGQGSRFWVELPQAVVGAGLTD